MSASGVSIRGTQCRMQVAAMRARVGGPRQDEGMAHPPMFDPADPVLARVREMCLSYPQAHERVSHGRPNFATVRGFCWYGGSQRVSGEWVGHDHAILVRPDPGDEPALRQDPRFFVPAYLGAKGWLGIDITDDSDWRELGELIDASYRATAPPKLVRILDGDT
jgi:predicted DNA-binding protein (MmcQ/YjbR family)